MYAANTWLEAKALQGSLELGVCERALGVAVALTPDGCPSFSVHAGAHSPG